MLSDRTVRFPWACGKPIGEGFLVQVIAETIQQTERRLAYARLQARTYSSYAQWAARLERELETMRQLQHG